MRVDLAARKPKRPAVLNSNVPNPSHNDGLPGDTTTVVPRKTVSRHPLSTVSNS
jgi:hypothetical protein